MRDEITLLGAGLTGTLMAIFLARQGRPLVLYERRPDLRKVTSPGFKATGRYFYRRVSHRRFTRC